MEKLHIDNTSGVLLLFAFIDSLMLALAYPAIRKVTGDMLPTRYFAIEGILSCACGLLVCMSFVSSISYLLGLTVVAIWPIPLDVSILLWGFGCFGDIGWLIIYRRHKQKLDSIDKN